MGYSVVTKELCTRAVGSIDIHYYKISAFNTYVYREEMPLFIGNSGDDFTWKVFVYQDEDPSLASDCAGRQDRAHI